MFDRKLAKCFDGSSSSSLLRLHLNTLINFKLLISCCRRILCWRRLMSQINDLLAIKFCRFIGQYSSMLIAYLEKELEMRVEKGRVVVK